MIISFDTDWGVRRHIGWGLNEGPGNPLELELPE